MIDSDMISKIRRIFKKEAEMKPRTEGFNKLPSTKKKFFALLFDTIRAA